MRLNIVSNPKKRTKTKVEKKRVFEILATQIDLITNRKDNEIPMSRNVAPA
jgi:hypothetical protein